MPIDFKTYLDDLNKTASRKYSAKEILGIMPKSEFTNIPDDEIEEDQAGELTPVSPSSHFDKFVAKHPDRDPEILKEGFSAIQERVKNKDGIKYGEPITADYLEDLGRERIKQQAPGLFKEGLRSLARGAIDLPGMAGKGMQWLDPDGGDETVSDMGKKLEAFSTETQAKYEPSIGISKQAEISPWYSPRHMIARGPESMVASLAPFATGLAAGAVAGPIAGAAAGLATLGGLFYGGAAEDKYRQAKESGLSDEDAKSLANWEGGIESGGELIADLIPLRLFGAAAKPVKDSIIKGITAKRGIKDTLKAIGNTMVAETATEVGQSMGQTYASNQYGVDAGSMLDNSLDVIGPTIFMSLVFGGAGAAHTARMNQKKTEIVRALSDPASTQEDFDNSLREVAQAAQSIDPKVAKQFTEFAVKKREQGQPVIIGDDSLYTPAKQNLSQWLQTGQRNGQEFTPVEADQFIRENLSTGEFTDEDLQSIKEEIPAVRDIVTKIDAERIIEKGNQEFDQEWNRRAGEGERRRKQTEDLEAQKQRQIIENKKILSDPTYLARKANDYKMEGIESEGVPFNQGQEEIDQNVKELSREQQFKRYAADSIRQKKLGEEFQARHMAENQKIDERLKSQKESILSFPEQLKAEKERRTQRELIQSQKVEQEREYQKRIETERKAGKVPQEIGRVADYQKDIVEGTPRNLRIAKKSHAIDMLIQQANETQTRSHFYDKTTGQNIAVPATSPRWMKEMGGALSRKEIENLATKYREQVLEGKQTPKKDLLTDKQRGQISEYILPAINKVMVDHADEFTSKVEMEQQGYKFVDKPMVAFDFNPGDSLLDFNGVSGEAEVVDVSENGIVIRTPDGRTSEIDGFEAINVVAFKEGNGKAKQPEGYIPEKKEPPLKPIEPDMVKQPSNKEAPDIVEDSAVSAVERELPVKEELISEVSEKNIDKAGIVEESKLTINSNARTKFKDLDDARKDFIDKKILEAGSIKAVQAKYRDDAVVDKYARERAAEIFGETEPTNNKSGSPESQLPTEAPQAKQAWEMTKDEFISSKIGDFVKAKGERKLYGFQIGTSVYQLHKDETKNGKLLKPEAAIRARIHKTIINEQNSIYRKGQIENALPYQKNTKPVPASVLADYPDLAEKYRTAQKETPEAEPAAGTKGKRDTDTQRAEAEEGTILTPEQLEDYGLYQERGGKYKYKWTPTGQTWLTANSKEDAIKIASKNFYSLKPEERLTKAERTAISNQEYDAERERRWGDLSIPELEKELLKLGGELEGLQETAKGEIKDNATGGRRLSAKAVAAEGARDLGQVKMMLKSYIAERKAGEGEPLTIGSKAQWRTRQGAIFTGEIVGESPNKKDWMFKHSESGKTVAINKEDVSPQTEPEDVTPEKTDEKIIRETANKDIPPNKDTIIDSASFSNNDILETKDIIAGGLGGVNKRKKESAEKILSGDFSKAGFFLMDGESVESNRADLISRAEGFLKPKPFKFKDAAILAVKKAGATDTHNIIEVDGGWIGRRKEDIKKKDAKIKGASKIKFSESDLNYQTAYNAYANTSFDPEKRAKSEQSAYVAHMNEFQDEILSKIAPELADTAISLIEGYRKKYLEKYSQVLNAKSRTMSPMITGPANFPTRRNQKALDVEHKRWEEFKDWSEKAQKAINRDLGIGVGEKGSWKNPIMSNDPDALELLEKKLEGLKAEHERTKKVAALLRNKKLSKEQKIKELEALGTSKESANKLLKEERIPSFVLANSNANIKRIEGRILELKRLEEQSTQEYPFEGGKIIDNVEDVRTQILFDEKPNEEMRTKLKARGFRWSPKNGVWQRQRSRDALSIAKQIAGLTQYSTTATPPGDNLSIPMVQKYFREKGQTTGVNSDGSLWIRLQNGLGLNIELVKRMSDAEYELAISSGKMNRGGQIAGQITRNNIKLATDFANKETLNHEIEHLMENSGILNSDDIKALNHQIKKFDRQGKLEFELSEDDMENRANFLAQVLANREQYRGTVLGNILQKIADFIDSLLYIGRSSTTKIARGMETGRIFSITPDAKPQFTTIDGQSVWGVPGQRQNEIQSWHGSPYQIDDSFSDEKLGSGEGIAAFGSGHYQTDTRAIAEQYARMAEQRKVANGEMVPITLTSHPKINSVKNRITSMIEDLQSGVQIEDLENQKAELEDIFENKWTQTPAPVVREIEKLEEFYNKNLKELGSLEKQAPGYLYQSTIHKGKSPDQYDYLDWYQPLTEGQRAKLAAKNVKGIKPEDTTELIYKKLSKRLGSPRAATQFLLKAGIDGIKYQAGSLSGVKDSHATNYVVFDPKEITINERIQYSAIIPSSLNELSRKERKIADSLIKQGTLNPVTEQQAMSLLQQSGQALYSTSAEVSAFRLANNIPEMQLTKKGGHPTQIGSKKQDDGSWKGTASTYEKIKNIIERENPSARILDYGAGENIGGRVMEADTYEPYAKDDFIPTYSKAEDIESNSYDAIINNAVLNVVPDDTRDDIVRNIGRILKPNGKAYINVRGSDVMNAKNPYVLDASKMEIIVNDANKAYQKGFKQKELVDYLADTLDDGFVVESPKGANKFSSIGAIITKKSGTDTLYSKSGLIQGFVLNGKAYIVPENIESGKLWNVVRHEVGVHIGQMLHNDAEFNRLKGRVASRRDEQSSTGEAIRKAYARAEAAGTKPEYMEEEVLGYLVEESPDVSIARKVIALIKKYLQKIGITYDLTQADMAALADMAIRREANRRGADRQQGEARFAKAEDKPVNTDTAAFKAWFGDSKVVDEDGKPLVVYHGTPLDIKRFDKLSLGLNTMAADAKLAFFFTSSPKVAAGYAGQFNTRTQAQAAYLERVSKSPVLSKELSLFVKENAQQMRTSKTAIKELEASLYEGIDTGANVMPVYLTIETPLIVDYSGSSYKGGNFADVIREAKEKGHDGVIFKNAEDSVHEDYAEISDVYAVFEPTQIKSVFNRGTFSSTNPDIRYSIAPTPEERNDPLDIPERSSLFDTLKYNLLNNLDPFKKVQEKLGGVSPEADVLAKETLRISKAKNDIDEGKEKYVNPIMKLIADNNKSVDDVDEYLYSRHAPEANERLKYTTAKEWLLKMDKIRNSDALRKKIKEIDEDLLLNPAMNPKEAYYKTLVKEFEDATEDKELALYDKWKFFISKPSGMTTEDANKLQEKWANDETMKKIAALFDKMNQEKLDISLAAGRMTPEEHQAISGAFEYYAPLHREGYDSAPSVGRGTTNLGRDTMARGGSTLKAVDILANAIASYEATIVKAHKAETARAFKNFIDVLPEDSNFISLIKPNMRAEYDNAGNIRHVIAQEVRDNQVKFKVDGVTYLAEANRRNQHAMRIIEHIKDNPSKSGWLVEHLNKVNRVLALVNTSLSPEFMFSNFIRDLQTASINLSDSQASHLTKKIVTEVPTALKSLHNFIRGDKSHGWSETIKLYNKAGAPIGWMDNIGDIEQRVKKLDKEIELLRPAQDIAKNRRALVLGHRQIKKVFNVIMDYNNIVENAVRLSTFKNAVDAGVSVEQAAILAKGLTVNFNQKGTMGAVMNSLYLFSNAGIQGSAKIISVLTKSKRARTIVGTSMLISAALAVANRGMGGDDDDGIPYYDKIDQFVKERNIILMIPWSKGKYAQLPLPWGYNVFWAMGEELGIAFGTNKKYNAFEGTSRMLTTTLNAFNPLQSATIAQTLSPTLFDPVVQVAENKTWSGSPLMPEKNSFAKTREPYSQRYWDSARQPSVWFAKLLNELSLGDEIKPGKIDISPEVIDMVWDTFTGSTGKFIANIISVPIKALSGDDLIMREIPFVRRFSGEKSEYADSKLFRANKEHVYQLHAQAEKYPERIREFKKDKAFYMKSQLESVEKKIKRLYKAKKTAKSDDIADQLQKRIDSVMMKFNAAYYKMVN